MEQFKKAKVVMLPTGFVARRSEIGLQVYKTNLKIIGHSENENIIYNQQHLYIISDDEIKEGDWCYNIVSKTIFQANKNFIKLITDPNVTLTTNKKIIATTDTSLIIEDYNEEVGFNAYNLPQPSQQFIEKYIECYNRGEVITDVLVEYEDFNWDLLVSGKTIINQILKINPKDNTITIKELKDSRYYQELNFKLKHIVLF
jgi:hypothetical protein